MKNLNELDLSKSNGYLLFPTIDLKNNIFNFNWENGEYTDILYQTKGLEKYGNLFTWINNDFSECNLNLLIKNIDLFNKSKPKNLTLIKYNNLLNFCKDVKKCALFAKSEKLDFIFNPN